MSSWGYSPDKLGFLVIWSALTVVCLLLQLRLRTRLLVALPPLFSLVMSAGWLALHEISLEAGLEAFFLFILSLLHVMFVMVLDARTTSRMVRTASLLVMLLTGWGYFTDNLYVLAFFWVVSVLPSYFAFDHVSHQRARRVFVIHHLVSAAAVVGGVLLLDRASPGFSYMSDMAKLPHGAATRWATLLLVLACLIRQAMFPFHLWFKASYKTRPFPLTLGFYAGNLGFLLFMKLALPLMNFETKDFSPLAMVCGVCSALYFANMALVQTRLRSTVFNVMLSQYATLYCGLEVLTDFGKSAVLFQLLTMGCCFAGLISCLYLMEWHLGELRAGRFHGLQEKNPLLASLFLLFSLCAMALPFSMGYAGEDLVFHAVISQHPVVGVGLILAAAVNGIALFRVVTFAFRGRRVDPLDSTIALSQVQKTALAVLLGVLLLFGLFPGWLLQRVLTFVT
jgi:NADH-quinone oxidoreductase subunit M